MGQDKAAFLNLLLELVVGVHAGDAGVAVVQRLLVNVLLDVFQQVLDILLDAVARAGFLLQRVAAHHLDGVVLQVTATHDETYGHTLHLVVRKLEARTLVVGIVIFHADAQLFEAADDAGHLFVNLVQLLLALVDGHDDHLDGSEVGREHQAVVVGVGHDEGTHQAGGYAPGGGPYIFQLVVLVDELYVEGLGKVLAQEVRRAALQGFAVLHHGLDGIGVQRAGKAFVGRLDTLDDGHGHVLLGKVRVDIQHLDGFSLCFLLRGMGRVAFLPQEFSRTQEEAGTHFPAEHVGPLVDQDGQVAVGVDPVLVRIPDDGFRSGADDQFLLQFGLGVYHYASAVGVILQAIVGDDGTFLGKSFHMFCLAAEEGFRDEQGEIGIDMARFLEHVIQLALHFLPDGISVGLYHHTAAYGGLFGQVGFHHQFVVPLRVVLATLGKIL